MVLKVFVLSASGDSSNLVLGPVVIQPDRSASATSAISSSEISGGLNEIMRFSIIEFSWSYSFSLRTITEKNPSLMVMHHYTAVYTHSRAET